MARMTRERMIHEIWSRYSNGTGGMDRLKCLLFTMEIGIEAKWPPEEKWGEFLQGLGTAAATGIQCSHLGVIYTVPGWDLQEDIQSVIRREVVDKWMEVTEWD